MGFPKSLFKKIKKLTPRKVIKGATGVIAATGIPLVSSVASIANSAATKTAADPTAVADVGFNLNKVLSGILSPTAEGVGATAGTGFLKKYWWVFILLIVAVFLIVKFGRK